MGPVVETADTRKKRRRTWPWWLLAVIASFLLGLWLGRGPAAKKPLCGTPGTVEEGGRKSLQGPGGPMNRGSQAPGDAPSLSGGGGTIKAPADSGSLGEGRDDDGDTPSGSGGGTSSAADDGAGGSSTGVGERLRHDLTKYAQGDGMQSGGADDDSATLPPQGKSYSASDFTYDKTNLPRYPDAVSAVVSSIAYGPDGRTDTYNTGAGIVTASSFDAVVSWYRQHLPPGWRNMTIGDMQQLSAQLSTPAIMQMLGAQPPANAAASGAVAPTAPAAAAPAADRIRLSLFTPPADAKAKVGVMIVQHGDGPVEALLHAKVAPSP